MGLSTKEILKKADLAVADLQANGGYLNPEQADRFIDLVIDEPTILKEVRTVKMNAPQRKIEKIGFDSRILHVAPASGTALDAAKRSKPVTDKVELNTTEYIAEVHIPYDVLEDNIERGNLEDTIMRHMAKRVAIDLEEFLLLSDTASADPDLAVKDGLLKQATSHVVDADGASISKEIFKAGVKAMPSKYLRVRTDFRFWTSPDQETEYRDQLADRETSLGDVSLEGYRPVFAYGVPVVPAALMPSNTVLFTHPKNIIFGVQRQISVETDKDIRSRVYIIVLTLRIDFKYETEDAVVKIINVGS